MVKRPFPIAAAITGAGSVSKLANELGVSVGAIYQWDKVPPLRVLQVERVSGVPRWVLRPDLYPPLDDARSVA